MSEQELAAKIIELVGGKGNLSAVRHCATRLRLIVSDKEKIDTKAIEALDKVKGSFFNSGQYQIILGTGLVNRVYDEVIKITGGADNLNGGGEEKKEAPVYGNKLQRAIRLFSDTFVPIIPVLVATGLFMGLRGMLTQSAVLSVFGLVPEDIPENLLIYTRVLTDTAFAFLPALVCWSTMRNFGGSPIIGTVLGLMLVNPALPNAYAVGAGEVEPLKFFGFLNVTGYQGSVLPAFAAGIFASQIEKFLRKHIPDAIDLILTPFLTLLAGTILAIFVIGPALHLVETGLLTVVKNLLFLPMGIGGLLYGSFGQMMGIFGIHHILNFLEISMLAQDGWNYLNPIGTCGNAAQAGAVLAVGLKAASVKLKQIAYPSCLSALLGITEPAVFGVNLKYMRPYAMALIGGGVGGFLASNLGLKATGMAITGIPGTLLYLNEQLPWYIFVNVVSFATAFVLTWLFGFNKKMEEQG
ncbi:MAG: PTS transporter subunit EIIC [Selenomonadaceae bacterium]|nr:PTS transporter subunit EIIC [Selenomonadaceae bacterium]